MSELGRDETGSALLEGAVVVPFLFTLVLGILEFSNFFFQQHLVSTGVRDAARYLARVIDSSDGSLQTAARNLAATGSLDGSAPARVAGFGPGNVTITRPSISNPLSSGTRPYREADNVCGGPDQILMINVTGSFSYTSLGFIDFFGLSLPAITVTHTERCIGPG